MTTRRDFFSMLAGIAASPKLGKTVPWMSLLGGAVEGVKFKSTLPPEGIVRERFPRNEIYYYVDWSINGPSRHHEVVYYFDGFSPPREIAHTVRLIG